MSKEKEHNKQYVCYCSKLYNSYAGLYLHLKTKHQDAFDKFRNMKISKLLTLTVNEDKSELYQLSDPGETLGSEKEKKIEKLDKIEQRNSIYSDEMLKLVNRSMAKESKGNERMHCNSFEDKPFPLYGQYPLWPRIQNNSFEQNPKIFSQSPVQPNNAPFPAYLPNLHYMRPTHCPSNFNGVAPLQQNFSNFFNPYHPFFSKITMPEFSPLQRIPGENNEHYSNQADSFVECKKNINESKSSFEKSELKEMSMPSDKSFGENNPTERNSYYQKHINE